MEEINRRVLVIDDMQDIHADYLRVLVETTESSAVDALASDILDGGYEGAVSKAGFDVDCASQGQKGVELVEKALAEGRPYAVAFVDVRMPPGWNGIETIRHIWQVDPDIQITIVTAYSDYSWGDITRDLGDTDQLQLLKKPFESIELLSIATSLSRKWDLMHRMKLIEQEFTIMDGHGEMILLLDGKGSDRAVGEGVLESLGYKVLAASDEQEAVALFNANRDLVDLALIDLNSGGDAVKRLQELAPELKVILCDHDPGNHLGYAKRAEESIIVKPFRMNILSQRLRHELET
ncbi:Response regulator receiver domain-containing protein [Mariprofundus aestuarium]|uniref:Response regulator receiver domain-containing protein n=1 Tax=Mariprofundus aestuarium TaxID=1921086 RepID=A0A2K8KX43_MARES|nr:Response regulator receiver domain-containing protein [Mariprofundus aestuarium]